MLCLGTMFLALSLREAGYSVWANTEASGTATPKLAEDANRRMERAGVHLVSPVIFRAITGVKMLILFQTGMFAIAMFLMKDWRNTPGTAEVLPYLDKVRSGMNITSAITDRYQYFPAYGIVARSHASANITGEIVPGERQLVG